MSEEKQPESLAADMSLAVAAMNIEPSPEQDMAEANNTKSDKLSKIDILLKATGDAPIIKKKRWAIDAEKPVSWIAEFVKRYLKLDPKDKLFLYVNQTFAPSPDQIVRNLYECFGTDGKLILHYCKTPAWG